MSLDDNVVFIDDEVIVRNDKVVSLEDNGNCRNDDGISLEQHVSFPDDKEGSLDQRKHHEDAPAPGISQAAQGPDLQTAETLTLTRAKGAAVARNEKRATLVSLLQQERSYVQGSPT